MRTSHFPALVLCCGLLACSGQSSTDTSSATTTDAPNNLMYAVAWKQTAAEYQALYHQGFNMARQLLQVALLRHTPADKPLAVISDLDETLLLAHDYWGYLIHHGQDFFDDSAWDNWVAAQQATPSPGALEFLRFCADNNIEVFYVTNRDQGDATFTLALQSLQALGFPYADPAHLTVLRESSNKEPTQDSIRENFDVVVMLGDNLNDFSRSFYVADVDERERLVAEQSARFGSEYIVFPNPTDGHWLRAIFGESEPAPTVQNRAILREAALRRYWNP